ncbi:MAG TPA: oxygen-dependent coproporphyrinogen oxidase [Chitinophagaceae bacterium]|nr:oxygen-dependent coproporphyrinogen oxidase [Chitinophagaceae bacterium]
MIEQVVDTIDTKEIFVQHIRDLQSIICLALEKEDGKAIFKEDEWHRPGGGGGITRIMQDGDVFEKAGVNFSEVYGDITPVMREQLHLQGESFYATGLSLVIHPVNPFVPTVHANFRYFELYKACGEKTDSWFGGGMDLTPYYLLKEEAVHFHQTIKKTCDAFDANLYPEFKKNCDRYFVNRHRNNEARGIGGIFFDQLKENGLFDCGAFVQSCSEAFIPAYLPIVQRHRSDHYTDQHKYWQEIRRGRYVEFNLLHDRGTLFGLKTNGRTESILMSLPPRARFVYDHQPSPGSEEEKLIAVCRHPIDWV